MNVIYAEYSNSKLYWECTLVRITGAVQQFRERYLIVGKFISKKLLFEENQFSSKMETKRIFKICCSSLHDCRSFVFAFTAGFSRKNKILIFIFTIKCCPPPLFSCHFLRLFERHLIILRWWFLFYIFYWPHIFCARKLFMRYFG